MQNSHGKEIDLSRVTVKIPGVIFRQTGGQVSSSSATVNGASRNQSADMNSGEFPFVISHRSEVLFHN